MSGLVKVMDLCDCRCEAENPAEDPSEALMTTTMIKFGGNNFQP